MNQKIHTLQLQMTTDNGLQTTVCRPLWPIVNRKGVLLNRSYKAMQASESGFNVAS